jgi:hypothetical protein
MDDETQKIHRKKKQASSNLWFVQTILKLIVFLVLSDLSSEKLCFPNKDYFGLVIIGSHRKNINLKAHFWQTTF